MRELSDEDWNREVPNLLKDLLTGLNHLHSQDAVFLHRNIKVCIGHILYIRKLKFLPVKYDSMSSSNVNIL